MTVSRVLHGGLNVRPEKVALVHEAVAALGYRRNENARSIRPGQRTGLIGVVITNVANPYYGALQLGVEQVVSKGGSRLLVGTSGESIEREQALVSDFIGRQIDGLIVVPAGGETSHLLEAQSSGIPVVLASRRLAGLDADVVLVDDIAGARLGVEQLIAEGHSRIAYLGNLPSVFTSGRRLEGFRAAHRDAGVPVDERLICAGQNDAAHARVAMAALLDLAERPTAVFSANNRNTVGVLQALADAGEQTDIRVVGFDNFDLAQMVPFRLSIIDHDPTELGRIAGSMIEDRLNSRSAAPPRLVELPTRLIL